MRFNFFRSKSYPQSERDTRQRESCRGGHAEDGGSPRALPRDPGHLLQSVKRGTLFSFHNGHPPTLVGSASARSSNLTSDGERRRDRLRLAARVVDHSRDSRVFVQACERSMRGGGALRVGPVVEAHTGRAGPVLTKPPAPPAVTPCTVIPYRDTTGPPPARIFALCTVITF